MANETKMNDRKISMANELSMIETSSGITIARTNPHWEENIATYNIRKCC